MIPERETLPEDFLDWDELSDKAASPLPAISLKGYQSREQIKVGYKPYESTYDQLILKISFSCFTDRWPKISLPQSIAI